MTCPGYNFKIKQLINGALKSDNMKACIYIYMRFYVVE
jgi:hypothetical protein